MALPQLNTVSLVESSSRPLGMQLVSSYAVNRNNDSSDQLELAKQVKKADQFTRANAGNKLTVIADQIRYLQEQAKHVLEDAKKESDLHHAACNFVKIPGKIYHLYIRESGQRYFSLLSPKEWGVSCPHDYLGAYRLENDMSWTSADELEKRNQEIAVIERLLNSQLALQYPADSEEMLKGKRGWAECDQEVKVREANGSEVKVEEVDRPEDTE